MYMYLIITVRVKNNSVEINTLKCDSMTFSRSHIILSGLLIQLKALFY